MRHSSLKETTGEWRNRCSRVETGKGDLGPYFLPKRESSENDGALLKGHRSQPKLKIKINNGMSD
jgi:hypothetical protein